MVAVQLAEALETLARRGKMEIFRVFFQILFIDSALLIGLYITLESHLAIEDLAEGLAYELLQGFRHLVRQL